MIAFLQPLGPWLLALVGPLVTQVLIKLGLGILTGGAVYTLVTGMLNQAQTSFNQMPALIALFLDMAGFGIGLGLLAGAIAYRASVNVASKFAFIPSGG